MASSDSQQRYPKILEAVNRNPSILNKDLAQLIGCAESTISRDLAELREMGWLKLGVDYSVAANLRERVSLSFQASARVESQDWGYKGRDELGRFLRDCLEHPEFQKFRGKVMIESVETVTGRDADVVVTIVSDTADSWRSFTGMVELLPGVENTNTRVVFRI